MGGNHAVLAPSAAERWLQCPASIRMEAKFPQSGESVYAREGTAAHALGELKARREFFGMRDYTRQYRKWSGDFGDVLSSANFEIDEMERHTDAYVELIRERLDLYPNSVLLLEQRMPTGLPDEGKGTSDAVILSPVHIEIIDFKYGQGVPVEAENNPQLRIYGHGALTTYGDVIGNTERVRMTVHQPRLHHVLTEELSADELRKWHASILPTAEEALGDDAHFGPSDTACRWCPASGRCKAQLEAVFAVPFEVDPGDLSPEEMAEYRGKVPMIVDWLKAFEEASLARIYSEGVTIPGYKVVMSGGQRKITRVEGALDYLLSRGYSEDEVQVSKIRGIGELEKLMGKEEFAEQLAPYITKSEGRPAIVAESDPRPSITPNAEAAKEFEGES